jgi:hypothetical protein
MRVFGAWLRSVLVFETSMPLLSRLEVHDVDAIRSSEWVQGRECRLVPFLLESLGCWLCLKTAATVYSPSESRCTHFKTICIVVSRLWRLLHFLYTDWCFGISISLFYNYMLG